MSYEKNVSHTSLAYSLSSVDPKYWTKCPIHWKQHIRHSVGVVYSKMNVIIFYSHVISTPCDSLFEYETIKFVVNVYIALFPYNKRIVPRSCHSKTNTLKSIVKKKMKITKPSFLPPTLLKIRVLQKVLWSHSRSFF